MNAAVGMTAVPALTTGFDGIAYNTLVVAAGVAAVGLAAGVVGGLGLLRKRPLVGDAAAHTTLVGVAGAFLATGRRDLPTLLVGALVAAVAGVATLVFVRRFTRTRDDAATAIVIGVGFGLGIALLSGITARGVPGSAGLEQFLLGHTAALTARDAMLLAAVAAATVAVVTLALKEATLVAFDAQFAAATGWPVSIIDQALVTLVAVMVVVGLPAAGAVLVTALVVIPPVAARQWTDRVTTLLLLAGLFGFASALAGVTASAVLPRSATGPLVVLAAAAICVVSIVAAPAHGWLARAIRTAAEQRAWAAGMLLDRCLRLADEHDGGTFARAAAVESAGRRPADARAWETLVMEGAVVPADRGGGDRWRLSAAGLARARERRRRMQAWRAAFDASPEAAREALTLDLPACPVELVAPGELAVRPSASRPGAVDRGPSVRPEGPS